MVVFPVFQQIVTLRQRWLSLQMIVLLCSVTISELLHLVILLITFCVAKQVQVGLCVQLYEVLS